MEKFVCSKCGSSELGYAKYVRHITPVTVNNGVFHYDSLSARIVEEDMLNVSRGFCCFECGQFLWDCGEIQKESDLLCYLSTFCHVLTDEEFWGDMYINPSSSPYKKYPDTQIKDAGADHQDDEQNKL